VSCLYLIKMLCEAFCNNGFPCKGFAKPMIGNGKFCKLHFQSRKRSPITWELFQSKMKTAFLKSAPLSEADKKMQIQRNMKLMRRDEKTDARIRERNRFNFIGWRHEDEFDEPFEEAPIPAALPAFHLDNQNIHRVETVSNVKSVIAKLMALKDLEPTDKTFNWSAEVLSATPIDIIMKCSISPAAGVLLVQKYASAETIYDMVPGIYAKVLDRVWQFVKTSDDSDNLRKILKIELQDNVGMCAQGNLSRLCNVLSGYIEELTTPPIAEILGDLLPPLASIASLDARYIAAVEILRTHSVPEDKWNDWLEPLEVDKFPPFTIATGGRL